MKTSYEWLSSYWCSAVCSSDLRGPLGNDRADIRARLAAGIDLELLRQHLELRQPLLGRTHHDHYRSGHATLARRTETGADQGIEGLFTIGKIGRASCRERVCQYV